MLIGRSHHDWHEEKKCDYCFGKRTVDNPDTKETDVEETDLPFYKLGICSTKMRVEDLETFLLHGFTRCGTFIYKRANWKSCCEVWQYMVNIDDFNISGSQKQVIKKFHNYLNYGNIHGQKLAPATKDEVIETEADQLLAKIKKVIEDAGDKVGGIEDSTWKKDHKVNYNGKLAAFTTNALIFVGGTQIEEFKQALML